MKTFKIFNDSHIKICLSFKRSSVLKILSTVFRGTYTLSLGFKKKPLQIFLRFPALRQKATHILQQNLSKEAAIHFLSI